MAWAIKKRNHHQQELYSSQNIFEDKSASPLWLLALTLPETHHPGRVSCMVDFTTAARDFKNSKCYWKQSLNNKRLEVLQSRNVLIYFRNTFLWPNISLSLPTSRNICKKEGGDLAYRDLELVIFCVDTHTHTQVPQMLSLLYHVHSSRWLRTFCLWGDH